MVQIIFLGILNFRNYKYQQCIVSKKRTEMIKKRQLGRAGGDSYYYLDSAVILASLLLMLFGAVGNGSS